MSYQLDMTKTDGTVISEVHEFVEATAFGIHIRDGLVQKYVPWSQIVEVTITDLENDATDARQPQTTTVTPTTRKRRL